MSIPGYDEWKLRSPYDDDYDDSDYEPEIGCGECFHTTGHDIGCSQAAPTLRVRLYRAWFWHVIHWRTPSIAMVQRRIAARWRKWFPEKPPIIDDDLPF